ncbi:MAG TPA: hypothetical protein VEG32_03455 [Clostridia bacterium]|nr:hypothetical protein [Clostridia bacterium]
MTNPLPTDVLEQRAAEQRRRLHNSVAELRSTVRHRVRERLDARRVAREYLLPGVAGAGILGLVIGNTIGGFIFPPRR